MRKTALVATILLFTAPLIYGQNPAELLRQWSSQSPIEKVYLHLDRDDYVAGGTIWFKAYLSSDYYPDTISTTLYVELFDNRSVLVDRKVLPVFFGNAFGQFDLGDSLYSGNYLLRAYSPTMLNHDHDFIYKRNIFIYGKNSFPSGNTPVKQIRLDFFPEGGNFLSGKMNTVAFKATDESGLPVDVNGRIINEKGESLLTFSNVHDGMGMFDINPNAGSSYYAMLHNDPSGKKFNLPAVQEKGIVMRIMPDPQGLYYEILQKNDDTRFQASYMVGQMQHHVVFTKEFKKDSDWITGVINTGMLNSGILQITIFNKDGIPLAERLSFIDNKEYELTAQVTADTLDFASRKKNQISIIMPDTIVGSFSVAITDPDYSLQEYREESILSRLLLTEDLKGFIHHPAWYFSSTADSVRLALDLLMMTHGWRRFTWTALQKAPPAVYRDPGYITLSGKVMIRDTKKPVTNNELIVLISSSDSSSNSMEMLATDQQGRFKMDSLVFFEKTRLFFNDIKGKKSKWVDVYLDADSITKRYSLPTPEPVPVQLPIDSSAVATRSKIETDYDAVIRAKGLMLEGVTVKSRKKSPIQELEEKYASGLFTGFSERTIDLSNTKETIGYANIFDFLRMRVPGLQVVNNGFDYTLYYRQTASLSSMGPISMTVFLNEVQTDPSLISTIPADMVAMVKVFSSFVGAMGNGAGGVLAIYTKKGADLNSVMPSRGSHVQYEGYSILKEFYAPDYAAGTNLPNARDHRTTLNWQPNLFVQAVNPKIPIVFYNNDRSRRFKVVVEGMTVDGKMLFFEKIFPTGKRAF